MLNWKLSAGAYSMAIYLSNTTVTDVYFADNGISAICLQNDTNRIYPVEIVYTNSGTGSYTGDFAVPAGYSNFSYTINISTANVTTVVLYNNLNELLNETVMSGTFGNTVAVSAGTIRLEISTLDSSTEWSFNFKVW